MLSPPIPAGALGERDGREADGAARGWPTMTVAVGVEAADASCKAVRVDDGTLAMSVGIEFQSSEGKYEELIEPSSVAEVSEPSEQKNLSWTSDSRSQSVSMDSMAE